MKIKNFFLFFTVSILCHSLLLLPINRQENTFKPSFVNSKFSVKIMAHQIPKTHESTNLVKQITKNESHDSKVQSSNIFSKKTLASLAQEIKPDYPHLSKVYEEEGEVTVLLEIRADGIVSSAIVKKSSGHSRLDQEAIRFLKQATYKPGKDEKNLNISSELELTVAFFLN